MDRVSIAPNHKENQPGQRGLIIPAFKAMQFAAAGVIVHELNGKIPVAGDWNSRTIAPTTAEIRQWRYACNYGVLTGSRNRNLVVIDLDTPAAIKDFEQNFSHLIDTYTVTTRRGQHKYYYCDQLPPTTKIPGQIELMADDADGQGGKNVVGEGSVHESGHVYTGNGKKIMRVVSLADVVAHIESQKPAQPAKIRNFPKSQNLCFPGEMTRYGAAILAYESANIASAPDGAGNDTVLRSGIKMYSAAYEGYCTLADVDRAIDGALAGWTYRKPGDKHAILRTVESARQRAQAGRNGRNPRQNESTRPVAPIALETPPEAESSTIVEMSPIGDTTQWAALPDGWRTGLLTYISPSIAYVLETLTEAGRRDLLNIADFTVADVLAAADGIGWEVSESTVRSALKFLADQLPQELETKELPIYNFCGNAGRRAVHYVLRPISELKAQILRRAAKRIYELCHPHDGDEPILPEVTPDMVESVDVSHSDAPAIAAELKAIFAGVYESQGRLGTRARRRAYRLLNTLQFELDNPYSTPLPAAHITRGADYKRLYLRGIVEADPDKRRSRKEICSELGISNGSITRYMTDAGLKAESQFEYMPVRSTADLEQQTEDFGKQNRCYPKGIVITRPDRAIEHAFEGDSAADVIDDALRAGYGVAVKFQAANKQVIAGEMRLIKSERPPRVNTDLLTMLSKGEPAPEWNEDMYNPAWVRGVLELGLKRLGYGDVEGVLYNPDTGERAPTDSRGMIEMLLGRSLSTTVDIDPDFYTRESTPYELAARHDFRMEMIGQGWKPMRITT